MSDRETVDTEELLSALEQALSQYFGAKRQILGLRRRRSLYSSSFAIENLQIELDRGKGLSLVFKDLSPGSLLQTARQVRPDFLYEPLREIETYQSILDPVRFGTPIFYGAVRRPQSNQYWLFLERVNGPLLWQVGRIETWRQAVRWSAKLHSEFANAHRGPSQARLAHLVQHNQQLLGLWLTRASRFLCRKSAAASGTLCRRFLRLADRYDRVIERLLALPRTFIHGEFYPSNVILRRGDHDRHICPIDWEVAALGPGLIDLAALTSGDWNPDQKRSLVTAYRDALEPTNGWPPSLPELMEAVDYCQLHLAVQWLGWAADWSPPKMHAQNWLREAVRLSTKLGI